MRVGQIGAGGLDASGDDNGQVQAGGYDVEQRETVNVGARAVSGSRTTRAVGAGVLAAVGALALASGGCGLSVLGSGVGSGVFGGNTKAAPQKIESVTAEHMLTAAKAEGTLGIAESEISHGCPRFATWPRDNTLTVYEQGRVGDGLAVVHRGEITKTARECEIVPGKVTVKYGFAGRILMGPKGRQGVVKLPVTVFVTDAKRERVLVERQMVEAQIAVDKPVGYFSFVRIISFPIPEGSRAGEFEVFVGFERTVPGAG